MKYFENAEIEIISFNAADVITTSGGDSGLKVYENGAFETGLDRVN